MSRRIQAICLGIVVGVSQIALAAEIATIAGTGKDEYSGDGGPALKAGVGQPFGLEIGPDGALYFCEFSNHIIRRMDLKTTTVSTMAGTGRGTFCCATPKITASASSARTARSTP